MQDTSFNGTPPRGASVNSGTISTFGAITAGHIVVNGVTFPALGAVASAAARCDQMVSVFNDHKRATGVEAVKLTATTYALRSGVAIAATLGATAIVASCGFVTSIAVSVTPVLLATRKQFGTNANATDGDVVIFGNQSIPMKQARNMGMLSKTGTTDIEIDVAQASTRVNS
jgi:hypothetical protein